MSVGYSSRRVQGASIGKEQALKKPDYAKITIFSDNATDLTPEGKIKGADRKEAYCQRALTDFAQWMEQTNA